MVMGRDIADRSSPAVITVDNMWVNYMDNSSSS